MAKDDFSGDDKENELDGASWSCPYEFFPFQIQACLLVVLCFYSIDVVFSSIFILIDF